ncbi:hypothetical protein BC936DRAFT_138376 [Jimgerdemannia flammicorona]|uniref:ABC transporter domain-containing protein n=1 Tax=Jimgerdemannia flammicorona TaxID=994334 RepID=A0A433CKA7_9FUNG|nr:hypothetical protein BC936DRAFT_138376 [Jimgerdemannia flammicorona]
MTPEYHLSSLRTVMDYTRILVLSEGQIAEFDTPYNLMEDKKSIFHSMCQKYVQSQHHLAVVVHKF